MYPGAGQYVIRVRTALYTSVEFASRYRLYSGTCWYAIFCSIAIVFQSVNRNSIKEYSICRGGGDTFHR